MKSNATSKAFPGDEAEWRKVLEAAPASTRRVSKAKEAAVEERSVVVSSGGLSAVSAALRARRPGQRGPQKAPVKKLVSLRLSPEVLTYFRSTGEGWQSRIDEVLRGHARKGRSSKTSAAPVPRQKRS